jgi:hypothetical protein
MSVVAVYKSKGSKAKLFQVAADRNGAVHVVKLMRSSRRSYCVVPGSVVDYETLEPVEMKDYVDIRDVTLITEENSLLHILYRTAKVV